MISLIFLLSKYLISFPNLRLQFQTCLALKANIDLDQRYVETAEFFSHSTPNLADRLFFFYIFWPDLFRYSFLLFCFLNCYLAWYIINFFWFLFYELLRAKDMVKYLFNYPCFVTFIHLNHISYILHFNICVLYYIIAPIISHPIVII